MEKLISNKQRAQHIYPVLEMLNNKIKRLKIKKKKKKRVWNFGKKILPNWTLTDETPIELCGKSGTHQRCLRGHTDSRFIPCISMGDGTLSYGGLANSSHRDLITGLTQGLWATFGYLIRLILQFLDRGEKIPLENYETCRQKYSQKTWLS